MAILAKMGGLRIGQTYNISENENFPLGIAFTGGEGDLISIKIGGIEVTGRGTYIQCGNFTSVDPDNESNYASLLLYQRTISDHIDFSKASGDTIVLKRDLPVSKEAFDALVAKVEALEKKLK